MDPTLAGSVRRFVVWWHRAVLAGGFAFLAVLLLIGGVSSDNIAVTLWTLVWLPAMLYPAVRGVRAASIEFRADVVVIYGLFRTRRIPLCRIRRVDIARGSSVLPLPWRVPYFELDDGSAVRADEIRSLRAPSVVDDVVTEARRRLDPT
jgi:hypothetical protein